MARVGKGRVLRDSFWREKIADQAGRGLSVGAYCRREGLSPNSFHGWRREKSKPLLDGFGARLDARTGCSPTPTAAEGPPPSSNQPQGS
jgi:hypothetical protein